MVRPQPGRWTLEEDLLLVKILAEGGTYRDAGRALMRTGASVRERALKLGVRSCHTRRRRWTPKDDERLANFVASGKRLEWICQRLGRTRRAVLDRICVLGLAGGRPGSRWSEKDVIVTIKMRAEGANYAKIGKKLRRSPDAVRVAMGRLRRLPTWLLPEEAGEYLIKIMEKHEG